MSDVEPIYSQHLTSRLLVTHAAAADDADAIQLAMKLEAYNTYSITCISLHGATLTSGQTGTRYPENHMSENPALLSFIYLSFTQKSRRQDYKHLYAISVCTEDCIYFRYLTDL